MENTITPTYKISVTFNWLYAGTSKRKVQKGGYFTESGTQEEVVEKFIETFIHSYLVGISKVEDMKVHRFDRILTVDEWVEKYNPIKNHLDENTSFALFLNLYRTITRLGKPRFGTSRNDASSPIRVRVLTHFSQF